MVELLRSRSGAGDAAEQRLSPLGANRQQTSRIKRLAADFDDDRISSIILFLSQAAGVYAFVMASLLSVFVAQLCPPSSDDPVPHVCSTRENFFNLSKFNKAVLAINFITLGCLVIVQAFYSYREYFCIQMFDFDSTLPADNLKEELELYPSVGEKLRQMNIGSLVLSAFLVVLVAGNFTISCILVLHFYNAGKSSVTGLISSALLITPRVLNWLLQARVSCVTGLPVSLFSQRPALPNTIDADFKFKDDLYVPNLGANAKKEAAPASYSFA